MGTLYPRDGFEKVPNDLSKGKKGALIHSGECVLKRLAFPSSVLKNIKGKYKVVTEWLPP